MLETNNINIDVFKDSILDENIAVQVDAIRRLPSLASAMDVERTREELIPCLVECIDAMPEESCFNLAEQLERLVPFVGGNDHVALILDILVKLACQDEVVVRERAVESMRNIYQNLDAEHCERTFYPLIESLIVNDWFTTKCSAGCLIAICYAKMPPNKQTELRNHVRNLVQDDSPTVRRSIANSLLDFVPLVDVEELKSEFVPIFDNLAQDEQDSVRALAVDVGIAISKKLKDFENYEYLLRTFKQLSEDQSWRVRQRIAWKLHEIRSTEKIRPEVVNMFMRCVRDDESEVRVFAAKNVYNLVVSFKESFKHETDFEDVFEKSFQEVILPEIYMLLKDPSDDVRVALSTNILSLSDVLRNECFNNSILPVVIDALENEEYMPFKENMLKNLSSLPSNVDIAKSLKSVESVVENLLRNSELHWRTRRNLLLAFMHISRNSTSDFFDTNLRNFYRDLLNDPIFAIRRTTPLILPLLIKHFGMKWAKVSIIPFLLPFSTDPRYLYRYTTFFAVQELITPTLENQRQSSDEKDAKYLRDFKHLVLDNDQAKTALVRISKLCQMLDELISETEQEVEDFTVHDNLNFYAEDTLDNLRKEQKRVIFSVESDEVSDCYLEGVLFLLVKNFVKQVNGLIGDPIKNVRDRAKLTLLHIKTFNNSVRTETEQVWVQEIINSMSKDDLKKITEEIDEELEDNQVEETEILNCDMAEPDEEVEPPEEVENDTQNDPDEENK